MGECYAVVFSLSIIKLNYTMEIKFRVWDVVSQKMDYNMDSILKNPSVIPSKLFCGEDKLLKVQFFTNFYAKNDRHIFDGDIIGCWCEVDGKLVQSKQQVYFDTMLGCWMLDSSSKQDKSYSDSLFQELQDFEYEVLGNIFQTPELLGSF